MSSVKLDGVLKAVKQVRGGVHVNHNKNTADCEVVRIPVPEKCSCPCSSTLEYRAHPP